LKEYFDITAASNDELWLHFSLSTTLRKRAMQLVLQSWSHDDGKLRVTIFV